MDTTGTVIRGANRDTRMTDLGDPSRNEVRWQSARVVAIEATTPRIKSFSLVPKIPFEFYPGQHVDVRLTAEDGYTALRSYSIASSPFETNRFELSIERLDNGEVSPFFHEIVAIGDDVEIRGPLGGFFILRPEDIGPILLIGGGSGVAPLMSMVRFQCGRDKAVPIALVVSARTWDDILYREELLNGESSIPHFGVTFVLTRDVPRRLLDYGHRIDATIVSTSLKRLPRLPTRVYICGSNPFVNAAADSAIAAGISPQIIRTERYGG